jgi:hypothetical protein
MVMKKFATILITIFLVTGFANSALAFGPGWDGHGRHDNPRGYARNWHDGYRGHDRGWHGDFNGHDRGRRDYGQHSDHNVPSHGSGAMISLPLVPLPGVSHLFPSINVNIH